AREEPADRPFNPDVAAMISAETGVTGTMGPGPIHGSENPGALAGIIAAAYGAAAPVLTALVIRPPGGDAAPVLPAAGRHAAESPAEPESRGSGAVPGSPNVRPADEEAV